MKTINVKVIFEFDFSESIADLQDELGRRFSRKEIKENILESLYDYNFNQEINMDNIKVTIGK